MKKSLNSLQTRWWFFLFFVALGGMAVGGGAISMINRTPSGILTGMISVGIIAIGLVCWRLTRHMLVSIQELTSHIRSIFDEEDPTFIREHLPREIGTVVDSVVQARLADRTDDLATIQKLTYRNSELETQSRYLETATILSRKAAENLDLDSLLQQVIDLIQAQFHFYFLGVYLLNSTREWGVLQAGTGQPGRNLMDLGYRVRVGEGIVGEVLAKGEPRFSFEVGKEADLLSSPELPLTKAEAVLPLIARDKWIGALSIHSEDPGKFDKTLVNVLQVLADFFAVAIDNAKQFSDFDQTVKSLEDTVQELSSEAWRNYLKKRTIVGYQAKERGVMPVLRADFITDQNNQDDKSVMLPLRVRGQQIGAVYARKPVHGVDTTDAWTSQEMELLDVISEHLGIALDKARVVEAAQQSAVRERVLSEVAAKIRTTTNMQKIMKTALEELAQALRVPRGSIHFRRGSEIFTVDEG